MSVINNNGRFQKGRKKTGGREKGTPNKLTTELRKLLLKLTIDRFSNKEFQENFNKLSPKEQWEIMYKLANKLIPSNFNISEEEERTSTEKEILEVLFKNTGFNGIEHI